MLLGARLNKALLFCMFFSLLSSAFAYTTVNTSITSNTTFASGTTYLVTGPIGISGAANPILTIQGGAVIKFAANGSLDVNGASTEPPEPYGNIYFTGTSPSNPVIFTSCKDQNFGDNTSGASGCSGAPNRGDYPRAIGFNEQNPSDGYYIYYLDINFATFKFGTYSIYVNMPNTNFTGPRKIEDSNFEFANFDMDQIASTSYPSFRRVYFFNSNLRDDSMADGFPLIADSNFLNSTLIGVFNQISNNRFYSSTVGNGSGTGTITEVFNNLFDNSVLNTGDNGASYYNNLFKNKASGSCILHNTGGTITNVYNNLFVKCATAVSVTSSSTITNLKNNLFAFNTTGISKATGGAITTETRNANYLNGTDGNSGTSDIGVSSFPFIGDNSDRNWAYNSSGITQLADKGTNIGTDSFFNAKTVRYDNKLDYNRAIGYHYDQNSPYANIVGPSVGIKSGNILIDFNISSAGANADLNIDLNIIKNSAQDQNVFYLKQAYGSWTCNAALPSTTMDKNCTYVFNATAIADANYLVKARATDKNGTTIVLQNNSWQLINDTTAPDMNNDANTTWQNADANVRVWCDDSSKGNSDINSIAINKDNNGWLFFDKSALSVKRIDQNALFTTSLNHTLKYFCSDSRGNTTDTNTVSIYIDKVAPDMNNDANAGWQAFDANVKISCASGLSDINSIAINKDSNGWTFYNKSALSVKFADQNAYFSTDMNHILQYFCSDTNKSDTNTVYVLVNKSSPILTLNVNSITTSGLSATITYSGTATSGIKKYWISLDGTNWTDNGTSTSYTYSLSSGTKLPITQILWIKATNNADQNTTAQSVSIFFESATGGTTEYCGDGKCNNNETPATCPADCAGICGDGACTGTETVDACPIDCAFACGDGYCSGAEDCQSCEADCGKCYAPPIIEGIIIEQTVQNATPSEENIVQTLKEQGLEQLIEQAVSIKENYEIDRNIIISKIAENSFRTNIIITVYNKKKLVLTGLALLEIVPKSVAKNSSEIVSGNEFVVLKADPTIEFIATGKLGEKISFSYYVNKKILDLNAFQKPIVLNQKIQTTISCETGCDDTNPCTKDQCINEQCVNFLLPDNSPCGYAQKCKKGICIATPTEKYQQPITLFGFSLELVLLIVGIILVTAAIGVRYVKYKKKTEK